MVPQNSSQYVHLKTKIANPKYVRKYRWLVRMFVQNYMNTFDKKIKSSLYLKDSRGCVQICIYVCGRICVPFRFNAS